MIGAEMAVRASSRQNAPRLIRPEKSIFGKK